MLNEDDSEDGKDWVELGLKPNAPPEAVAAYTAFVEMERDTSIE